MEEVQGYTTDRVYVIKHLDIFTSNLYYLHCPAAASKKERKEKKKEKKNPSLFWMLDSKWQLQQPEVRVAETPSSSIA